MNKNCCDDSKVCATAIKKCNEPRTEQEQKALEKAKDDYRKGCLKLNGVLKSKGKVPTNRPSDDILNSIIDGPVIGFKNDNTITNTSATTRKKSANTATTATTATTTTTTTAILCICCKSLPAKTRPTISSYIENEYEYISLTSLPDNTNIVDLLEVMNIKNDEDEDAEDDAERHWPGSIGKYHLTHCWNCAKIFESTYSTLTFLEFPASCGCGVESLAPKFRKHNCYYCNQNVRLLNKGIIVDNVEDLRKEVTQLRKTTEVTCDYCKSIVNIKLISPVVKKGTKSCEVEWCKARCRNFSKNGKWNGEDGDGEWNSEAAEKERLRLDKNEMLSQEEKDKRIATAAGRCTNYRNLAKHANCGSCKGKIQRAKKRG